MKRKKDYTPYIIGGVALVLLFLYVNNQTPQIVYSVIDNTNSLIPNNTLNQPIVPLTCEQTANKNNAFYTENNVNCLNYATLDCQDKGKQISGWALTGTCCYYTCEVIVPQLTCADTDNGITTEIFGTCGDNSGTPYIEDNCLGGSLFEQSCIDNKCVAQQTACPAGKVCDFGRCVTP